jgi:hypothetical protein
MQEYPLHTPPTHISTFPSNHLAMLVNIIGIDKLFELVTIGRGAIGE